MTHIVTGLFERHRDVDLVVEHLVQEFGVPRERVQVHAGDPASGEEARSPQDSDLEVSLADLGLPEDAARGCAEGMRRGGILVAAWMEAGRVDHALAAFREYGAASPGVCDASTFDPSGDWEQRVRLRAYQLWEQEGRPEGRDLEFWDRACRALKGERGDMAERAPQEFAGETGAAPLPEPGKKPRA